MFALDVTVWPCELEHNFLHGAQITLVLRLKSALYLFFLLLHAAFMKNCLDLNKKCLALGENMNGNRFKNNTVLTTDSLRAML